MWSSFFIGHSMACMMGITEHFIIYCSSEKKRGEGSDFFLSSYPD